MRQISQTWTNLVEDGEFRLETVAVIDGVEYSTITAPVIEQNTLSSGDGLAVGGCSSACLRFTVMTDDAIRKAAQVVIKCRVTDETTYSEWVNMGTFWVNTRNANDGLIDLECYDAMMKGNQPYTDSSEVVSWPKPMGQVVSRIATLMGVVLDSRTSIPVGDGYMCTKPGDDDTLLTILGYIGGVLGGNWIITQENKLRMIPLIAPPPESYYIVDEKNYHIQTDDNYNLVWRDNPATLDDTPPDGVGVINVPVVIGGGSVGRDYIISRVTMEIDSETGYTAGDDTGYELRIENNPYASQFLCNALYSAVSGVQYRPFTVTGATYDPATEVGDWFIAGTLAAGVMYNETRKLDLTFSADASAPGDAEIENEFPYMTELQRVKNATTRTQKYAENVNTTLGTRIDQTQAQITLLATKAEVQELETSVDTMSDRVDKTVAADTMYYLATNLSTGVTVNTPGWTTTVQSVSSTNKYLWIYHVYTYADATLSNPTTPYIAGVYGDQGLPGAPGQDGADGTSVNILGSYDTYAQLIAAHPTGNPGDAYIVGGDLYVWSTNDNDWIDAGAIQGPSGESAYIRYSANSDGSNMTTTPTSTTKYIGVLVTDTPSDSNDYTKYTWSQYVGDNGIGVAEVVPIYYASNSAALINVPLPQSKVTTQTTDPLVWTTAIPILTDTYKYLFTCDQVEYTNHQLFWSNITLDTAFSNLSERLTRAEIAVRPDSIISTVESVYGEAPTTTVNNMLLDTNAPTLSRVDAEDDRRIVAFRASGEWGSITSPPLEDIEYGFSVECQRDNILTGTTEQYFPNTSTGMQRTAGTQLIGPTCVQPEDAPPGFTGAYADMYEWASVANESDYYYRYWYQHNKISLPAGDYEVSCYVKVDGDPASVTISCGTSVTYAEYSETFTVDGNNEWVKLVHRFTLNSASEVYAQYRFFATGLYTITFCGMTLLNIRTVESYVTWYEYSGVNIEPGKTYTVSCYARTDSVAKIGVLYGRESSQWVYDELQNPDNDYNVILVGSRKIEASEWELLTWKFTASDDVKHYVNRNTDNGACFYFIVTENGINTQTSGDVTELCGFMLSNGGIVRRWDDGINPSGTQLVNEQVVRSEIYQSSSLIRLQADRIAWKATYSEMTEDGSLTVARARITNNWAGVSSEGNGLLLGRSQIIGVDGGNAIFSILMPYYEAMPIDGYVDENGEVVAGEVEPVVAEIPGFDIDVRQTIRNFLDGGTYINSHGYPLFLGTDSGPIIGIGRNVETIDDPEGIIYDKSVFFDADRVYVPLSRNAQGQIDDVGIGFTGVSGDNYFHNGICVGGGNIQSGETLTPVSYDGKPVYQYFSCPYVTLAASTTVATLPHDVDTLLQMSIMSRAETNGEWSPIPYSYYGNENWETNFRLVGRDIVIQAGSSARRTVTLVIMMRYTIVTEEEEET